MWLSDNQESPSLNKIKMKNKKRKRKIKNENLQDQNLDKKKNI